MSIQVRINNFCQSVNCLDKYKNSWPQEDCKKVFFNLAKMAVKKIGEQKSQKYDNALRKLFTIGWNLSFFNKTDVSRITKNIASSKLSTPPQKIS